MSFRTLACCLLACFASAALRAAESRAVFEHFTLEAPLPDTLQTDTLYKISGVAAANTSNIRITWVIPALSQTTFGGVTAISAVSANRTFTVWVRFKQPGDYQFSFWSMAAGDAEQWDLRPKRTLPVVVTQKAGPASALPAEFLTGLFGRLQFAQPVVQYTTTIHRPLLTLDLRGTSSKAKSIDLSLPTSPNMGKQQLRDDGTNGDLVAADSIYSVQLPDCKVTEPVCTQWIYRPPLTEIGIGEEGAVVSVTYENGGIDTWIATLGLLSADIELVSLEPLAATVFKTDYLLNIVDTTGEFLSGGTLGPDWYEVGKRFYQFFPDRFDFLFFRLPATRNDGYGGYYQPVNIGFSGTGRVQTNASALYGSKGKLQGYQYVNFLAWAPQIHEMMHHWANQTPFLNAGDGSHWGVSNTDGVLGGRIDFSKVTSLGNNEYSVPGFEGQLSYYSGKYSKLELYMAGLVPASEVPPVTILKNAAFVRNVLDANGTITSQVYRSVDGIKTYTIDDIVRELGPRTPAFGAAQTQFTAATVVVSPTPIDRLTATWLGMQMKHFSSNAQSDYAFAAATGFRATLDSRLGEPLTAEWPQLGNARNATGGSSVANAVFSGGAANANTASFAGQFGATQVIDVMASIEPDPAHVGKNGRLFVLAVLDNGSQFMQNASGRFVPFTGLANMVPRKVTTLERVEFISVASGLRGDVAGLTGRTIAVYVGYALDSAPQEIWSGSSPIRFTIGNP